MTNGPDKDIGVLEGQMAMLITQVADVNQKMDTLLIEGSAKAKDNSKRLDDHDTKLKRLMIGLGVIIVGGQAGIELIRNLISSM